MIQLKKIGAIAIAAAIFSCKKDIDPIIIIPPSKGSQIQLNGLVGNEAGANAGNSIFIDFSSNNQKTTERKSWDLGFYCGTSYRVIINNTTSASAKKLSKNDLTQVNNTDTVGFNGLVVEPTPSSMALVDNVLGDLNKTVIDAVSQNEADNKVYIINPGTGGGTPAKDWYKIRILRNGEGVYQLQYAKLAETTFKILNINKDVNYNFKYISFENGLIDGEPLKAHWDIKWSFTTFHIPAGSGIFIPYGFSDFITINVNGGVGAAEVMINNNIKYEHYTKAEADNLTFSNTVDAIGTKWRTTSPNPNSSGVKKDRFYVIKDPAGNIYKLKFLSFHGDDGGTRGKPVFKYDLLQ